MRYQMKPNQETKTLNEVTIQNTKFNISDKDLKQFILDIINLRPDILEEDEIKNKILLLRTYDNYIRGLIEEIESEYEENED